MNNKEINENINSPLINQYIRQNKIRIFDYNTKKELYILQDVANLVENTHDIYIKNDDVDLISELENMFKSKNHI